MTARACVAASVLACLTALSVSACGWPGSKPRPAWVDGAHSDYPSAQYLIGVGQSDTRNAAADQAYAAVARIFKAEVAAEAKDWESYLVVEQRGLSHAERRLTLDTVTKVSTDKVLENVRILETWYDGRKGLHYALAGMSRPQAEAALLERMATLDQAIESDVEDARRTADKLVKVRALRRALRNLMLREAYNADLRVVRASGQGAAARYRVSELSNELDQFLAAQVALAVQMTGDQGEPSQRALTEGLIREGLHVVTAESGGAPAPELLVRGAARIWPIALRDPQFSYVRWCSDFDVIEVSSQRVVGALSRGGKEGHLTEREAVAKAVRVMQQQLSTDVAKAIAAHIFGEAALPAPAATPAGCPRDEPPTPTIR